MPTGIVLKSASPGATQKDLEDVLTKAGYEVDKPEETKTPKEEVEPKRENFKTDEEFEAAHVDWQDAQEETSDEEGKEEKRTPKPSRKQRAIDRATKELKKQNEELLARLEKLEGKAPPDKKASVEDKRPMRAEFPQTDEGLQQYEDALLAWGTKKALGEKAIKDAQAANQSRFEENLVNFQAQCEEARETHEDWDELEEHFKKEDVNIGRDAQLAILELENGAEVTYYLMRHPVFAAKLGEMSPLAAIMEVGRLSTRLKTGTPGPGETNGGTKKPKPNIPAPVKHVDTTATTQTLTFAEIAAKPPYPGKARDLKRALARQ